MKAMTVRAIAASATLLLTVAGCATDTDKTEVAWR